MSRVFTLNAISQHNKVDDLYLVIKGNVYDVTQFHKEHPGGPEFLLDQGGTDVSELFENAGHSAEARALLKGFHIGTAGEKSNDPCTTDSPTPVSKWMSSISVYWVSALSFAFIVLSALVLAPSGDLSDYLNSWRFSF